MNKNLTKKLTMGAAVTAVFVALYAIFAIDNSVIQELIAILSVIPLTLYTKEFGIKTGLLAMLSCMILSAFLVQPAIFLTYTIPTAIIGTVLGILIDRKSFVVTVGIISLLNIVHIVYELIITSFFMKISITEQYIEFVTKFSTAIAGHTQTVLYHLVHDMALCSIPVIFVLGAVAKGTICYIVTAIVMKRLFKEQRYIYLPKLQIKEKPIAFILLCMVLSAILLCALVLSGTVEYSFPVSVFLDAVILSTYLYIVHKFRQYNEYFRINRIKSMLLVLLMIILFPVTACVFALLTIFQVNR